MAKTSLFLAHRATDDLGGGDSNQYGIKSVFVFGLVPEVGGCEQLPNGMISNSNLILSHSLDLRA